MEDKLFQKSIFNLQFTQKMVKTQFFLSENTNVARFARKQF